MESIRRHPALVAYLILAAFMVIGFYRVEHINSDLEKEIRFRQQSTCAAYDQLEDIIRSITLELSVESGVPSADLSPEVRRYVRQVNQNRERFRGRIASLLEDAECPVIE